MFLARRLTALALTLLALGAGAWAVDQRNDEVERSAAEITRQSQQLQQKALDRAADVQAGTRDAEDVASELQEDANDLAEDAIEEMDVDVPESAEDDLEAAGIDVD